MRASRRVSVPHTSARACCSAGSTTGRRLALDGHGVAMAVAHEVHDGGLDSRRLEQLSVRQRSNMSLNSSHDTHLSQSSSTSQIMSSISCFFAV